ncbi:MAG: HAMP domain-containing protein [Chloroflexi bacterium]|nr:HAMP domain-containing protein [Chloroflexota bacterium]
MLHPKTLRTRLVVAFLTVVLVPLIGTGLYGNWVTSKIIQERAVEAAHNDTLRRAQQIDDFLDGVRGDVLYLANLDDLQELLAAREQGDAPAGESARQQLSREFLVFSRSHLNYYQIRYLDETGQEIVRVDSDGQAARIVPANRLQNKASRYYFTDTIQLPPGMLYVSPLDLNREFGAIEFPYRPVIRYATPIYHEGQLRGIVIINIFAERFLAFLDGDTDSQTAMLVDQDGYYLAHPDQDKRWGSPRDLDTGENLHRDYPELASTVLAGEVGSQTAAREVLVYAPVYPLAADPGKYWMVVHAESVDSMFAPITAFRVTAATILAAAVLVAISMILVLSRRLTDPLIALQQGVKRFGEEAAYHPLPVLADDEIGQLTGEFNRMADAIQGHIWHLTLLNEAAREIAAGLERKTTSRAILTAARRLLDVEQAAFVEAADDGAVRATEWQGGWDGESWPQHELVLGLYRQAREQGTVQIVQLEEDCAVGVAPLRPEGTGGLFLAVCGKPAVLQAPAAAKLFTTLAAQADIALQNVALYERLEAHRRRLSSLLKALITAQEEERKLIAYDLHDGLIQYLVGARLCLSGCVLQNGKDEAQVGKALSESLRQLATAIQEGRRLIEGLRPTLLDDLGLAAALRELTELGAAAQGWELDLQIDLEDDDLDPSIEITAFRIVQEALSNVRKYAQAKRVELTAFVRDGRLRIQVRDGGQGFDLEHLEKKRPSVGLASMRERAELVGGRCEIHSAPGEGTLVSLELPLRPEVDTGDV